MISEKRNSGSAEASYTYNANNLRASKTVNREKIDFVWNGQNLAAENKSGEVNTYTYDPTGVHIANQNGNITSYLKDYHDNVVGTTTVAGTMVQEENNRMDYDAFGNQWIGDTPDPFGYCGEYYDSESGLIYLRNRYYDSNTGRFINEDPIKDGLNWYSYCGNNPVSLVDPSGLDYGFDDKEYANKILDQINTLTGGEGSHGYTLKEENGIYLVVETGESFSSGSDVARAIINAAIDDTEHLVLIQHDANLKPEESNAQANKNGQLITMSDNINDEEIKFVLIHETTHAITALKGIDNRIVMNVKRDGFLARDVIIPYMQKQYKEALAVTIENAVRRDFGYILREGENGIGVNCYGTFPVDFTTNSNVRLTMELDDGNKFNYPISGKISDYVVANTFKSFGTDFENYCLANYRH